MFNPAMFDRKADIRGIYPNDINEELAFLSGRYLVRSLNSIVPAADQPVRILIGRDGRTSSTAIYSAMVQGIHVEGGIAIAAGLATTDMIQWGVGENLNGSIAGVMITASHNPAEYNGIKMVIKNDQGGIDILRPLDHLAPQYAADGNDASMAETSTVPYPKQGRLDLQRKFVEAAMSRSDRLAEATGKVVLDPGNGVGGVFRPLLTEAFQSRGASVELLAVAERIDGRFPTRPSNPGLPGAVELLQKTVVEEGAAFGAAFDGDADRVFIVDEKGEFVPGSVLLAALAKSIVEKSSAADKSVVYSAVSSWLVPETVRAAGGVPVISRVGQDAAKVALAKTKAVFGGESSAHYNFPDTFCLDSGLFALITFWEMLIETGKTCSELLAELSPWPWSGEVNLRFECADWKSMSTEVIDAIKAEYTSPAKDCYLLDIDGASFVHPTDSRYPTSDDLFSIDTKNDPEGQTYRIVNDYTPKWWFNVRASNNEPLLRVNFETRNTSEVQSRTMELVDRIREICGDRARVTIQDRGNLD